MKPVLSLCLILSIVALTVGPADGQQEGQVADLVKQLKDKDEFVRLKAAKTLGTLGAAAKDALPALTEALKDADPDVREVAKSALAKVNAAVAGGQKAEAMAALENNLKAAADGDVTVRRKAAVGLGSLLGDKDDIIRLKAAQALSELGGDAEPAAESLKAATNDADEAVRKAVRRSLEKIETAKAEAKAAKIKEELLPIVKELKAAAPEAKIRALEKIATYGPDAKDVGESLVEAMLDRLPAVRNAASEALEKVEPTIQPHVFQLLYGERRHEAATSLKKLGPAAKSSLPALLLVCRAGPISPQGWPVGVNSLAAITEVGPNDPRVAQTVLQLVVAWKGIPRLTAISALDRVEAKPKDKAATLLTVLQEEVRAGSPAMVVPILEAMEKLGQDAAPAIPLLKQLKFAQNDATRNAAVKALAKIE